MRILFAAFAASLLTLAPAAAQPIQAHSYPAGTGSVSGTVPLCLGADSQAYPCPLRATPTGGNVVIGTGATTVIPSTTSGASNLLSYQVQGVGYACLSWVTATVTISGSGASSTCGGAGAFLVTAGSAFTSAQGSVPNTALTAVGAAGAALSVAWQAQ